MGEGGTAGIPRVRVSVDIYTREVLLPSSRWRCLVVF